MGDHGRGALSAAGVPARALPLRARADAERADLAEALEGASMAFFSGGNPRYLAATLKDTAFCSALIRAIDRGVVFGGCSAGAIVASRAPDAKPRLGTSWLAGLGLIPNASFRVHWDKMRYLPGARPFLMSRLDHAGVVRRDRRANGDPRRRRTLDRPRRSDRDGSPLGRYALTERGVVRPSGRGLNVDRCSRRLAILQSP